MRNRRLALKRASFKAVKLGTIPASQTREYRPANPAGPQFHLGHKVRERNLLTRDDLMKRTLAQLDELAYEDFNLMVKKSWRKAKVVDEILAAQDKALVAA